MKRAHKIMSPFLKPLVYQGSQGTCFSSNLSLVERMMLMSTYEEFMVILTVALLIVAILNLKNKK